MTTKQRKTRAPRAKRAERAETTPGAAKGGSAAGLKRTPIRLPGGIKYAIAFTLALLALRLWLAGEVGFGDSEALYASYALHPQPAYLDHPGLIGLFAAWLGDGHAPAPLACHVISAFLSSALPWLGVWAAWELGADKRHLHLTAFALLLMPEISIGLFGFTPDLLLVPLWILALGAFAGFLKAEPSSTRALGFALLCGACLGLGVLSKVSMSLLLPVFAVSLAREPGRRHLSTLAPWGALLIMGVLCWPFVAYEIREGFPMWQHRLVATQGASGFSLRNLGTLIGGQVLYVTPPFLLAGYLLLRRLDRQDPAQALLLRATWIPALPLIGLCLWSKVAEPHWIGPCYLGLCLAASRLPEAIGRKLRVACAGTGGLAIILAALWVGTDLPPKLLGKAYEPRYDLANDMHAWDAGVRLVKETITETELKHLGATTPPVVGPHWVICAQLHAGLQRRAPIGCRTPEGDDFRRWYPEASWWSAPRILYVTDDRFEATTEQLLAEFPDRRVVSRKRTTILRGRVPVRRIEVTLLERNVDVGRLEPGDASPSPPYALDANPWRSAPRGAASGSFEELRSFAAAGLVDLALEPRHQTAVASGSRRKRSPALVNLSAPRLPHQRESGHWRSPHDLLQGFGLQGDQR